MSGPLRIRPAVRSDVSLLLSMITELAEFERSRDQVTGTVEQLEAALFGPRPVAEAVVAEVRADPVTEVRADSVTELRADPVAEVRADPVTELRADPVTEVAGFAIYFHSFSTWVCKPGLYLEDLYVLPEHRGAGVGRALLAHLARIAVERGCARFEWSALKWNAPAIGLYERVGAERLDEWDGFRLSGEPLAELASEAQQVP